jgi:hypothetical protein
MNIKGRPHQLNKRVLELLNKGLPTPIIVQRLSGRITETAIRRIIREAKKNV